MKTLSILLYNYNQGPRTARIARTLSRMKTLENSRLPVQVTVVDDGSDPENRRALETLPGAIERQFHPTRRGLAYVLNPWVQAAPEGVIAVHLPSIELPPEGFETLVASLEGDPGVGLLSPRITLGQSEPLVFLPLSLTDPCDPSRKEGGIVVSSNPVATGPRRFHPECFFFSRSLFEKIGPLRTDLGPGQEVLDWASRAEASGFQSRCLPETTGRIHLPQPGPEPVPNRSQAGELGPSEDVTEDPSSLPRPDRDLVLLTVGFPDLPRRFVAPWEPDAKAPLVSIWDDLPSGAFTVATVDGTTGDPISTLEMRKSAPELRKPERPSKKGQPDSGPARKTNPEATSQEKTTLEAWEVDLYRPGDEQAICDCFERVFGKPKPMDVWNWQFRDNPAGIRAFVARTPSGRIVAQFAGLPVRMTLDGDEHIFTQMVDNMVDPDYRQGLRRKGVFSEVVYRYVDHFGNPTGESVGFGLPNPQAYRIGRRLLGYSHIRDVYETSRILTGVDAEREEENPSGIRLEVTDTPPQGSDQLFAELRSHYPLTILRDSAFLRWRYTQSPLGEFRFISAHRTNDDGEGRDSLLGYIVLRIGYLEDPGTSALVDWFTPEGQEEVDRALVRRCEKVAIENGAGRIVGFFPQDRKEVSLLQGLEYQTEQSNWLLVGRTYHPEVKLEWVGRHWYYTLGEFDLV